MLLILQMIIMISPVELIKNCLLIALGSAISYKLDLWHGILMYEVWDIIMYGVWDDRF